jgi:hypothetical protein
MKTQIVMIAVLSAILLALPATTHITFAQTGSPSPSTFSIVNPGPSSNPSEWNASSNVGGVGTPNFIFYDNDTGIGSTFFVNVTVTNATNLFAWGLGIVYNNATLEYIREGLPSDNIFAPVVAMGVSLVSTPVVINPINSTYQEIECGEAYYMTSIPGYPSTTWDFNGTGTLCQVEFKIIAGLNSTTPEISENFGFDPAWTGEWYWPSGTDVPQFETGAFSLSGAAPIMSAATQSPDQYSVQPGGTVLVSINVTDTSGIQNVTLYYTNDTTMYALPMSLYNSTYGTYQATLPGFDAGTTVTYNITAFTNLGIMGYQDNDTYLYAYTVVPEFPAVTLPIIFAAFALGTAIIVLSKKRSRIVPK